MNREALFVRSPAARLVIASATALFLELSCIRWAGSHVIYLSYVSNLMLITAFLGLGLGTWLGGAWSAGRALALFVLGPFVLLAFVACVAFAGFAVSIDGQDVIYFGNAALRHPLPAWVVLPVLGLLVTGCFTSLAAAIGCELKALAAEPAHGSLAAYSLDVFGSLFGIALFSAASFFGTPAQVWFAAVCLGWLVLLPARRAPVLAAACAALFTLGIVEWCEWGSAWSPYQRVSLEARGPAPARQPGDPAAGTASFRLRVNNIVHQFVSDVRQREPFYEFPYRAAGASLPGGPEMYLTAEPPHANWHIDPFKPRPDGWHGRVAIIGAGNGTDVAAALAYDAAHIDAVELDPLLARIGSRLQPNRPFADRRVQLHIEDGRTFLERSRSRYDVIVFALPDSLTLASPYSSVRLESFLFTEEAFTSALRSLDPDHGLLVLYNYYRKPWLVDRIAGTLARASGHEPLVLLGNDRLLSAVFFAGPGLSRVDRTLGAAWGYRIAPPNQDVGTAVDDWPFLYLREHAIPRQIWFALGLLLTLALGAVWFVQRLTRPDPRVHSPRAPGWLELAPFFLMGVAFLMLETSGLVRMALLFGSTWFVNALVFSAVLTMVLIANALARRFALQRSGPLLVLLLAALGLAFALRPAALAAWDPLPKYLIATCVLFLPILLANLLFSRAFRASADPARAFAANLIGAVFGGALENAALVTGHSALLLIAAGLYIGAWFCERQAARSSERKFAQPQPLAAD